GDGLDVCCGIAIPFAEGRPGRPIWLQYSRVSGAGDVPSVRAIQLSSRGLLPVRAERRPGARGTPLSFRRTLPPCRLLPPPFSLAASFNLACLLYPATGRQALTVPAPPHIDFLSDKFQPCMLPRSPA